MHHPHKVFGTRIDCEVYIDRLGAYLIAEKDGKITVIQTEKGLFSSRRRH